MKYWKYLNFLTKIAQTKKNGKFCFSNIFNFLPLKIVTFGTKIQIDYFANTYFRKVEFFGQKMEIWHTL